MSKGVCQNRRKATTLYLEPVQATLIDSIEALDVSVSVTLQSGPVKGGLVHSHTTEQSQYNKKQYWL